jgi:hypothetical protein
MLPMLWLGLTCEEDEATLSYGAYADIPCIVETYLENDESMMSWYACSTGQLLACHVRSLD